MDSSPLRSSSAACSNSVGGPPSRAFCPACSASSRSSGVLLPVMLALTGRWREIVAAAVTLLILFGLAGVAFGTGEWTAYMNGAMPTQTKVFLRDYGNFMVH